MKNRPSSSSLPLFLILLFAFFTGSTHAQNCLMMDDCSISFDSPKPDVFGEYNDQYNGCGTSRSITLVAFQVAATGNITMNANFTLNMDGTVTYSDEGNVDAYLWGPFTTFPDCGPDVATSDLTTSSHIACFTGSDPPPNNYDGFNFVIECAQKDAYYVIGASDWSGSATPQNITIKQVGGDGQIAGCTNGSCPIAPDADNLSLECGPNNDADIAAWLTGIETAIQNSFAGAAINITNNYTGLTNVDACTKSATVEFTVAFTHSCIPVRPPEACMYSITVTDNTPPMTTAPPVQNLACTDALPPAAADVAAYEALGGTVDDACSADTDITLAASDSGTTADIDPCTGGTITRTYTFEDECGLQAMITQDFVVAACPPCSGIAAANVVRACDDGDPCTINDMEEVDGCDLTTICVPCAGTPSAPPAPTLTCPTELNACATDGSNIFDCMFSDANPDTQAMGTEANPIIGGSNANVVSNTGIIDASTLSPGAYTFTLNYESPMGCFGTPVTCTFTVINPKSADAGAFPRE